MTDRLKGVVVTFDKDYRDDDAEVILNAIRMIKGVLSVEPATKDYNDLMNRSRIAIQLKSKVITAISEVFKEADEKGL